jgi:hypothetical protein
VQLVATILYLAQSLQTAVDTEQAHIGDIFQIMDRLVREVLVVEQVDIVMVQAMAVLLARVEDMAME